MKKVTMLFGHSAAAAPEVSYPSSESEENYSLQTKTVTPSKAAQSVVPDSGFYGLSAVSVEAIPENFVDASPTTAAASDVLNGKKFLNANGQLASGSMPNIGAVNQTISPGGVYTIPKGYHNGSGKVTASQAESKEVLNFSVVSGTTQPASPKENTIWVNSATAITSYVFSATEPENPAEGMVWLRTGSIAAAPFNALTSNVLMVYPAWSYQYKNGAWVSVTALTYQGDAWVEWHTYLFNKGAINTELTGGIYYPAIQDGAIYFYQAGMSAGTNKTYSTKEPVDITDFSVVKARFMSTNTISHAVFRLCVISKAANGTNFTTSQLVANVSEYGPFNGEERVAELDISALTGEYYLGYAFGVKSSATAGNIGNSVYEWWLE